MGDADKTPVDRVDTMELVLERLTAIEQKVDDANRLANRTFELQFELHEHMKKTDDRLELLELRHTWLPIAAMVTSLFAVGIAVLVAFGLHH